MQTNYETKEAAYDAEILPLMEQVFHLCQKHKINHFSLFQLDGDGASTGFASQRVIDQDNKADAAPEIIACSMIASESCVLAVSVISAVTARHNERSAEENPHGIAD